ncbi:MAG: translational GTPase TypA, partial [Bacteroidia bacterium]|nr:translational GTPase TypA [Bacteroidia bacterium]
AKNVSIRYKDTKINILDTPGHSDFGGEVERVLRMADGVLLLVDAFEGPMPQTRYVTEKAVRLGLKIIVVINKVDKPNCRPEQTLDAVFDLLVGLGASDEQLDFPVVYGSGKHGWMGPDWKQPRSDVAYLLDTVLSHIPPAASVAGPLQMQITSLDYSNYLGRIAIGRIHRGSVRAGQNVALVKPDGTCLKARVKEAYVFEGLTKTKTDEAFCGDVCALAGLETFEIGDTVADPDFPEAMPPLTIDEPTLSMLFTHNDSPFFGREGKFVTSRHIRERLFKETEKNLALRVEETDSADKFLVYGRGVLHLSVLIETMRREGYELQVGQPRVILKEIEGRTCEPFELLVVDVPQEHSGRVIELATLRKGELTVVEPKGDLQHLEFVIPARGLIGLRSALLTATGGEATMSHRFLDYRPCKGEMPGRDVGLMISKDTGPVVAYALFQLQDRGRFFVSPGQEVYGGQIVGQTPRRDEELIVNLQKTKHLTNIRAAGSDEAILLEPPLKMSLEQCLEFIEEDEYVEITPQNIRMRKIFLDENERKRRAGKKQALKTTGA